MTDETLRKMNRAGLLKILYAQSRRIEALEKEVKELRGSLEAREIEIAKAGSIAEAALRLNHVFEAAQAAADQYLDSLRAMDGNGPEEEDRQP